MIIHEPEVREEKGEVILSARVEFANPVSDVPERLWYRFPAEYAPYLTEGGEPFAAALVQTAMYWGEDLEVRGRVSPRFAYGLDEYAGVFQVWRPKTFKPIEIKYREINSPDHRAEPRAVGQAFSGGVDSFFTLWSHLPDNMQLQDFQVTHGIFTQGVDFELYETETYVSTYKKLGRLFKDLGLTLIPAATNYRDFWRYRLGWDIMYGAPLIGAANALGKLFSKFYVASGYSYFQTAPAGSTYVVDHLLSSETLAIIHHGARFNRYEKMKRIVEWDALQKYLRVCVRTAKPMDGMNCGKCNKCLHVAARLEMFGVHDSFKTFPQPFSLAPFLYEAFEIRLADYVIDELLHQAADTRRWDIYIFTQIARILSWLNQTPRNILNGLLPTETKYQLKKRFYSGTPNRTVNQDLS